MAARIQISIRKVDLRKGLDLVGYRENRLRQGLKIQTNQARRENPVNLYPEATLEMERDTYLEALIQMRIKTIRLINLEDPMRNICQVSEDKIATMLVGVSEETAHLEEGIMLGNPVVNYRKMPSILKLESLTG